MPRNFSKEFIEGTYKAIGTTEKMGKKVFGTKFPEDVEKALLSMGQKERVILIRSLVVEKVRNDIIKEQT